MNRKYPIGIESFYDIRIGGYVYIDKTRYIYDLVNSVKRCFLARPHRFGKSLLLSTMEEYFLGRRELFRGLLIEEYEHEWTSHPVMRFNFTGCFATDGELASCLAYHLARWEREYCVACPELSSYGMRLANCVIAAYEKTGQRVVILVDEYDQPIIDTIGRPEIYQKNRDILRSLYGALKSLDRYLRFVFVTGVSKIGNLGAFNLFNNFEDISLSPDFASICGINEGECRWQLREDLDALAKELDLTQNLAFSEMSRHYGGYHFCENAPCLYNPYGLLNMFKTKKYQHRWFESEMLSFLIEYLKQNKLLFDLFNAKVDRRRFYNLSSDGMDIALLMYHGGYLTIRGFNKTLQTYQLGIPNLEVEEGMCAYLLNLYYTEPQTPDSFNISSFVQDFESGKVEGFIGRLSSFLTSCPYGITSDSERHFQNLLFILSRLFSQRMKTEYYAKSGLLDMIVDASKYRYVFGFKIDQTAQAAIAHIRSKEYPLIYTAGKKSICLIGVNLSTQWRKIDDYRVEIFDSQARE